MSNTVLATSSQLRVGLDVFAGAFDRWLSGPPPSLLAAATPGASTEKDMEAMKALMKALYIDGWSRYGWPAEVGGLGGTIFHRAVMWERLAQHGIAGMAAFEHLEVLGPTLVAMGPPEFVADAFPRFLDGSETWAQGFSEPEAGSDLASLRTRAEPVGGGFLITGRKIWTSWARFARWCLVLARTGSVDSRHRGLSAFIVDLSSPGVEVRSIDQANGHNELAEVTFDGVYVPADRMVGTENGGWAVAMHILSHERGTFAWFRHGFLYKQLISQMRHASDDGDGLLGDAILDLACVRAASFEGLQAHQLDAPLGPRAGFTKLLLCEAEQSLYDWVVTTDADIAIDPVEASVAELRDSYLFSRIVTIYGGSQQMQLDTIAKQILRLT